MNLKNLFLKHCEDNQYEINHSQLDIIKNLKNSNNEITKLSQDDINSYVK